VTKIDRRRVRGFDSHFAPSEPLPSRALTVTDSIWSPCALSLLPSGAAESSAAPATDAANNVAITKTDMRVMTDLAVMGGIGELLEA